MKNIFGGLTVIIVLLLVSITERAYSQVLDNEAWFEVNASMDLFKNADLDVETGLRRNEDFGNTKMFYFQTEFEYEIVKNLDIGLGYRFTSVRDELEPNENRLAVALSYELDLGKLDIQYRVKYQEDYPIGGSKAPNLRNRLKFDYNLSKKIDPFLAFEAFYDADPNQKEFEQIRGIIGFELDLPKGKDFTIYYMSRNRFNVGTPGSINVFGISYSFGKLID